jgi:outer membrane protein assembly factor BamA
VSLRRQRLFTLLFSSSVVASGEPGLTKESAMSKRTVTILSFTLLCGSFLLAQEWQAIDRRLWNDKNNVENYAAYLIQVAYGEHGYCGAKIEVKQSGAQRLFVVDPGPLFHLKEVVIDGPQAVQGIQNTNDTPNPGDVYSQASINEWTEKLVKQYEEANTRLKLVRREANFDRPHALVTVRLTFQEQP